MTITGRNDNKARRDTDSKVFVKRLFLAVGRRHFLVETFSGQNVVLSLSAEMKAADINEADVKNELTTAKKIDKFQKAV